MEQNLGVKVIVISKDELEQIFAGLTNPLIEKIDLLTNKIDLLTNNLQVTIPVKQLVEIEPPDQSIESLENTAFIIYNADNSMIKQGYISMGEFLRKTKITRRELREIMDKGLIDFYDANENEDDIGEFYIKETELLKYGVSLKHRKKIKSKKSI